MYGLGHQAIRGFNGKMWCFRAKEKRKLQYDMKSLMELGTVAAMFLQLVCTPIAST
jgi:hypothetical protein